MSLVEPPHEPEDIEFEELLDLEPEDQDDEEPEEEEE